MVPRTIAKPIQRRLDRLRLSNCMAAGLSAVGLLCGLALVAGDNAPGTPGGNAPPALRGSLPPIPAAD